MIWNVGNARDFPTLLHLLYYENCTCMHVDFKVNINGMPLRQKMNDFTIM